MAKKKPGVMLYFETKTYIKNLSFEQRGRLLTAILDYGDDMTDTEFEDVALRIVWDIIKPRIDIDDLNYRNKSKKAQESAQSRWKKVNADDTDVCERILTHTNEYDSMRLMPTTTTSSSTTSPTTSSSSTPADDDDKRPGLFDEGFGELIRYYEDRINPTENQLNLDKLKPFYESMGLDCCKRAIDIAVSNNVYRVNYVLSVLRDKQKNGIKSIEAWDDYDNRMKGENNNGRTGYGRRNDGLERTPEEILEEGARRWGIKL